MDVLKKKAEAIALRIDLTLEKRVLRRSKYQLKRDCLLTSGLRTILELRQVKHNNGGILTEVLVSIKVLYNHLRALEGGYLACSKIS
jgi:hypothetical protein